MEESVGSRSAARKTDLSCGHQYKVTGMCRMLEDRGPAYGAQGQCISEDRSIGWKPEEGIKQKRWKRAARDWKKNR